MTEGGNELSDGSGTETSNHNIIDVNMDVNDEVLTAINK